MSLPKAREFRNLSQVELDQKMQGIEKELHELRQKKVTGQLDKPHFFKQLRRQLAQIRTIESEKKHGK